MKDRIKEYCDKKYAGDNFISFLSWNDKNEIIDFDEFMDLKDNEVVEVNYDDGFFYKLDVSKFDDKLLFEYIYLGDDVDYHKDWSYKKFMSTFKNVCEPIDDIYINNYNDEEDREFRSFFLATIVDIKEYKNFNEAYNKMGERCEDLIRITENKLKGISWDEKYERDEKLFCEVFLTPFFKTYPFKSVRYTHGNKEFGKDYILEFDNIFGKKEFYGVQAKAGDISGGANALVQTIVSQINMAFSIPYQTLNENIYISKLIIATSGRITDNAKEIIKRQLEPYKFTNTIFMDKQMFISLNKAW